MGHKHYTSKVEPHEVQVNNIVQSRDANEEAKENVDNQVDKSRVRIWTEFVFRYWFFRASVIFVPLAFLPSLLFKRRDVRNTLGPAKAMTKVSKRIDLRWTIEGEEKLKELNGQCAIIMVNHQDYIDILGLFEMWPKFDQLTVICKHYLKYYPFFGILAIKCGMVFINRQKRRKAMNIIIEAVKECKKTGTKILIYPEGEILHKTNEREFLPFKKGGFVAAIGSQIPILPVVFSYYDFIDYDRNVFAAGTATIKILDPISTEGLTNENVGELMEFVRNQMLQVFRNNDGGSS